MMHSPIMRPRWGRPLLAAILAACLSQPLFAPTVAAANAGAEPDIRRDAAVIAIERVMPSVVNIATETVIEYHDWYDDLLRQFYGSSRLPAHQQRSVSLGSGVIIDEEGHILTNFHVVHRASRIQVKLWDGKEYDADPVVATQSSDVALLKIRAAAGEKFRAIRFAKDDDLMLGETVLALGNPFGLGGSVTKGILSSKNRRPSTGNEPLNVEDWLQTDAAINPGNSGGPLVNLRGELIGLNVAVYREQHGERGMGVGFSIPVKQVSAALSDFFTPEVSNSLWFGARFRQNGETLTVAGVQKGSPAAKAGVVEGDAVREVNGNVPKTLIEAQRALVASPERRAKLVLSKSGEKRVATVQLMPFEELIEQRLGLTCNEITPTEASKIGVPPGSGLLIENVEPGSPAAGAELKRGFILSAINGRTISETQRAGEMLSSVEPGQKVQIKIIAPRRVGGNYVELRQGVVELRVR